MNRSIARLVAVWLGLALPFSGCASDALIDDGDDTGLSAQDLLQLPEPDTETDLAEVEADEASLAVPDDASKFDTPDATPLDDVAVDDDDDAVASAVPSARIGFASALVRAGLHPRASDALRSIGITAGRIVQTIGNAPASAGVHKQDGVVNGHPYCAATDLSVRGLSDAQIRNLLERLGRVGFAAWFRQPGHDGWPANQARHIHAVYANAKMKAALRSQVRSWLVGRNGLRSNTLYGFYHWTSTAKATVRGKFARSVSRT